MANSPFIFGANGATSLVPGGVNLPGSTSGTLQLQPAASTTSYTLNMPSAQGGANTVALNDGSGNLSWTSFSSSAPSQSFVLYNLGLNVSVSSNAMTIALKQADGSTNPSTGTSAVSIGFRSSTGSSGAYSLVNVTSSLSITIPSGATLGQTSAVNQYVWVYAINNAGTVDLCVSGVSLFQDNSIQSTTAITSGSTSGSVLYSNSAYSSLSIRLIGRLLVNETTAGTWASNTTDIVLAPKPYPTLTDWASYTLTATGTTTNPTLGTVVTNNALWKRIGGDMLIYYFYEQSSGGSVGSGSYLFPLPSPYTINTSIISVSTTGRTRIGDGMFSTAAFPDRLAGTFAWNSTNLAIYYDVQGTGPSQIVNSGTGLFNGASVLNMSALIPITGWSTFGP
jgi:hypothetical protein